MNHLSDSSLLVSYQFKLRKPNSIIYSPDGGVNAKGGDDNLLIGQNYPENCMKMGDGVLSIN